MDSFFFASFSRFAPNCELHRRSFYLQKIDVFIHTNNSVSRNWSKIWSIDWCNCLLLLSSGDSSNCQKPCAACGTEIACKIDFFKKCVECLFIRIIHRWKNGLHGLCKLSTWVALITYNVFRVLLNASACSVTYVVPIFNGFHWWYTYLTSIVVIWMEKFYHKKGANIKYSFIYKSKKMFCSRLLIFLA